MTLKTKLITSVSMFFLVVALLMVGVWAVSTAQVTMGGTISFNATNIYATITGKIEGATTTPTLSTLNYSAKTEPDATAKGTWCQDLTFADATIPTIKWTVTIENKSERALYVSLIDNITSLTNATKTLTFDGGSADGEQTIPAKTSKIFTMEIKVSDTNASATVDYDFDFILRDISTDAPSYVEFVYDDTAMTATMQYNTIVDTSITEAYIPAKVTKDGKEYDVVIGTGHIFTGGIFAQCTSLKTVIIADGITSIGGMAFMNCKSIETIIIPDSVTEIASKAFSGCSSLTSIRLPEGLTIIDSSLFQACTSLEEVYIPDSVKIIAADSFSGCTNLTYTTYGNATYLGNENNPYHALILSVDDTISSCTINENCKVIAGWAFYGCANLTTMFIPESVKSICNQAFANCSALYEVQMESAMPPALEDSTIFNNCHANFRVAVPQSAVETYQVTDYWKNYSIGFNVEA